jgi:hypothetical protein
VLGVALQYTDFRYPHEWRGRAPKIAQWHAGIVRRKSFRKTLPPEPAEKKRRSTDRAKAKAPPPAAQSPVPLPPGSPAEDANG